LSAQNIIPALAIVADFDWGSAENYYSCICDIFV